MTEQRTGEPGNLYSRSRASARSQFRPPLPVPFKIVSPSQIGSPMFSASSYPSSPCSQNSGQSLGRAGRTVREYDKEIEDLRKENFSLKLRIYLLEKKFAESVGHEKAETLKLNVQLQMQLESLQNEFKCKARQLEETVKTAQENETAYRKAKEKIFTLEQQVAALTQELQSKEEKFSTPLQSDAESEIFKEAFGLHSDTEETKSSPVHIQGQGSLQYKISELERDVIAKDMEIQDSNAKIKELQERVESLQIHSRKKSIAIQGLVQKLKNLPDHDSKEMWFAVNGGIEAAKKRDISGVISSIKQIKMAFCQLVSMTPEELFQDGAIDTEDLRKTFVVKDKQIQELKEELFKQQQISKSAEEAMAERLQQAKKHSEELKAAMIEKEEVVHEISSNFKALENELSAKQEKIAELQEVLAAKTSALESLYSCRENLLEALAKKTSEMNELQALQWKQKQECESLRSEVVLRRKSAADICSVSSKKRSELALNNVAVQTLMNGSVMDINTEAWDETVTKLAQSDCKEKLREEIFILLLRLEQKERDVKSLKDEIVDLQAQVQEVNSQKSAFGNQLKLLQQHLEKLTEFMEKLIENKSLLRNVDSITTGTSEILKQASRCLEETLQLSHNLSESFSTWDLNWSSRFDSLALSTFVSESSRNPLLSLSRTQCRESLYDESEKQPEEHKNDAGVRTCNAVLENHPLGQSERRSEHSALGSDSLHVDQIAVTRSGSAMRCSAVEHMDAVSNTNTRDGAACSIRKLQNYLSSDSDIWSEPDRNLSSQRVGIGMTGPQPSPPRCRGKPGRKDSFRNSSSEDCDAALNCKDSRLRRKRVSGLLSKTELRAKSLADSVEKQLSAIGLQQEKLDEFVIHFERMAAYIADIIPAKEASVTEAAGYITHTISSLKSALDDTLSELKLLKGALKENSIKAPGDVVRELKEDISNILTAIGNPETEQTVSADEARSIAERALSELEGFKAQLLAVCQALAGEGTAPATVILPASDSGIKDASLEGDASVVDSVEQLQLSVVKQRTENIKLKQIISHLIKEKQLLESESCEERRSPSGSQRNMKVGASHNQEDGSRIICSGTVERLTTDTSHSPEENQGTRPDQDTKAISQNVMGGQGLSGSAGCQDSSFKVQCVEAQSQTDSSEELCEHLKKELCETRQRLLELDAKCCKLENELTKVLREKNVVVLENAELKENVKALDSRICELAAECSSIETASAGKVQDLKKCLIETVQKLKCSEAQNIRCEKDLQKSEGLAYELKAQLSETQQKLNQCLQHEAMCVTVTEADSKRSSFQDTGVQHSPPEKPADRPDEVLPKDSDSPRALMLRVLDLNEKFSIAEELLKQKLVDCSNLKDQNLSLQACLDELKAKNTNMESLVEKLQNEMSARDQLIRTLKEKEQNLENAMKQADKQLEKLDEKLLLHIKTPPNTSERAVHHDSELVQQSGGFHLNDKISELSRRIHRENIVHKFLSLVKSSTISSLRMKLEERDKILNRVLSKIEHAIKDDDDDDNASLCSGDDSVSLNNSKHEPAKLEVQSMLSMQADPLPKQFCANPSKNADAAGLNSVSQLERKLESNALLISELKNQKRHFESEIMHFRSLVGSFEGNDESSSRLGSESLGDCGSCFEQDCSIGTKHDRSEHTVASPCKAVRQLETDVQRLEQQLSERECALGNLQKERDFLNNCMSQKEELRLQLDARCGELADKVCKLESETSLLREQNESLQSLLSENETLFCRSKQETSLLNKQLQEKSSYISKMKEDVNAAFQKISSLEKSCMEHSSLARKLESELKEKTCFISQLSDDIKNKTTYVKQLEMDLEQRNRVLKELDECLCVKSHDYNVLEVELKNKCEALNRLELDLQHRAERASALEREVRELKSALDEKTVAVDRANEKLKEKDKTLSELDKVIQDKTDLAGRLHSDLEKLKHIAQNLKAHLQEKESHIRSLESELSEKNQNLDCIQSSVSENKKMAEDLQARLAEKTLLLEASLKVAKQKDAVLYELHEGIQEKSAMCMDLQQELDTARAGLKQLQGELSERTECIEKLKEKLRKSTDFAEELKMAAAGKDQEIIQLQSDLRKYSEELCKVQDELDSKTSLVEQLKLVGDENSAVAKQLENEKNEKCQLIERMERSIDKKDARINECERDAAEKSDLITRLESDLKRASKDIEEQFSLIQELRKALQMKESMMKVLESRSQLQAEALQRRIATIEEELCHTKKSLLKLNKQDLNSKNTVLHTGYKLKAILPAEKENFAAGDFSASEHELQVKPTMNCSPPSQETGGTAVKSSQTDTSELIQTADESPDDRKKSRLPLVIEHCEGAGDSEHSAVSKKFHLGTVENETLCKSLEDLHHLSHSKWNLQRSILVLQAEIFKDSPLNLRNHMNFIEHIKAIHSEASAHASVETGVSAGRSASTPCRETLLRLKLDIEFLENIRLLLKYFIIPLMKETVKSDVTYSVLKANKEMGKSKVAKNLMSYDELRGEEPTHNSDTAQAGRTAKDSNKVTQVHVPKEECEGMPAVEQSLGAQEVDAKVGDEKHEDECIGYTGETKVFDGTDQESAGSCDNFIALSRTESQTSFPGSCESRSTGDSHPNHKEREELSCIQSRKIAPKSYASNVSDAMVLRSNYSSPDLGIESDPNQDIPVVDSCGSENSLQGISEKSDHLLKSVSKELSQSFGREHMEGVSVADASLCVIGMLQDFELLKKEIQECIIGMKSISSRAVDGLQHISKSGTPKKLLEHATLNGILDSCSCIEVFLKEAQKLTNHFNIVSLPLEPGYWASLVKENQDLKQKLFELQQKMEVEEVKFSGLMDKLKHEERKKMKKERALAKQLIETKKLLRMSKGNLLGQPGLFDCSKPHQPDP